MLEVMHKKVAKYRHQARHQNYILKKANVRDDAQLGGSALY
jgi:hypothetical protein